MGYGIVAAQGESLRPIDFGVLTTTPDQPIEDRLRILYDGLTDLIRRYSPTEAAIEKLFFSRNVSTAIAVGQARGVAIVAAANAGLGVREYSPQEVKQSVAVYGKATKAQIQQMVKVLLGLKEIPWPDDAADALAIAICHLNTSETVDLIRRQAGI